MRWTTFYTKYKQPIDQSAHFIAGLAVVYIIHLWMGAASSFMIMMSIAVAREIWQHWNRADPVIDELMDFNIDGFQEAWDKNPPLHSGSIIDLIFFAIGGAFGALL